MKKIGIIGAMELEVEELKSQMEEVCVKEKASMEFYQGTLNGKEVVVVRSGIGKASAGGGKVFHGLGTAGVTKGLSVTRVN